MKCEGEYAGELNLLRVSLSVRQSCFVALTCLRRNLGDGGCQIAAHGGECSVDIAGH